MQLRCIHTPSSPHRIPPSKICIDICPSPSISLTLAFCISLIYHHCQSRSSSSTHSPSPDIVDAYAPLCISHICLMHFIPSRVLNLCIYYVLRFRCVLLISLLLSASRPFTFNPKLTRSRIRISSHSITAFCSVCFPYIDIVLVRLLFDLLASLDFLSFSSTYTRAFGVPLHSNRHSDHVIDFIRSIRCNKYANIIRFNISCTFRLLRELRSRALLTTLGFKLMIRE